ncbi:hypothetical protein GCM10027575_78240 [Phytohabitans suffuscus]
MDGLGGFPGRRVRLGVIVWTAKGEAAGATVRTTTDVAVAQISKKGQAGITPATATRNRSSSAAKPGGGRPKPQPRRPDLLSGTGGTLWRPDNVPPVPLGHDLDPRKLKTSGGSGLDHRGPGLAQGVSRQDSVSARKLRAGKSQYQSRSPSQVMPVG